MDTLKIITALKKAVRLLSDVDKTYANDTLKFLQACEKIRLPISSHQDQTLSNRLSLTKDTLYHFGHDVIALDIQIYS